MIEYECFTCEETYSQEEEKGENIIPQCEECKNKLIHDVEGKPIIKEINKSFEKIKNRVKTELKERKINNDLKPFREEILTKLLLKQRDDVTEIIKDYILNNNNIYTIRSDEKLEMWIYNKGIYIPSAQTFIKEECEKLLLKAASTNLINQIILKIEIKTYIDSKKFFNNINPEKIVVENGILNLKTKILEEYNPEEIFFSKIPVYYDPKIKPVAILEHLNTVLKSEEDVPVVQELIGLCLEKKPLEKSFLFVGTGRNGKSKTEELIKRFLGAENCTSLPLQELDQKQYALTELHNKLANLGADISSTALKETAKFKAVTGGDMISADRKFLTRLNFVSYAKMIFSCNEIPKTYDTSFAFFNRWIILDFPYEFVTKKELNKENQKLIDLEIINKISTDEELTGLLNWSLEGLERYNKNKDFSYSKNTNEVKNMWIRKSNSFQAFTMDLIEENYDSKISKEEMRRAYIFYCRKHRINTESDKTIKRCLTDLGAFEDRFQRLGEQITFWGGLKFKSMDSMDSNGFSTYRENVKNPKSQKTPTFDTTLTFIDDKNILLNLLKSKNDSFSLEFLFKESKIERNIFDKLINYLLENGEIISPKPSKVRYLR